ncbi:MAG: transporter substrate-binding domain-containing protein [Anaerolineaceae bacterium]|nr:transporter substrate-binding domain-containing protein [Anaerolineaceae bacterium]
MGLSTTYETWLSGDTAALGLPDSSLYADPPSDITIVPLQTDNDCFQSIQAGRDEFSVFLTSNTVVQAAINGDVAVVRVGSPVFSENLAVAFDKSGELDNSSLVNRVSEIIAEMHEDGTLGELSMKWFSEDLTMDPTQ